MRKMDREIVSLDQLKPSALEQVELLSCAQFHQYKKGETIYHEDTPSMGVYYLNQGNVKIFSHDSDGREIIFRFAGPGDLIGHSCIFRKQHMNSATAIEDTWCCFIESAKFIEMLDHDHTLAANVLEKIGDELVECYSKNIHLVQMNVRERLAAYFDSMAQSHGQKIDNTIKINLTPSREEIASYIGTAHETAIRFISEFKSLGLIKEIHHHFYILDPESISKLAKKHMSR